MEQNGLSECELLIMKVIWRSENAMSIQEIYERVESIYRTNWKSQTVSVFLGRMVKKGFLTRKKSTWEKKRLSVSSFSVMEKLMYFCQHYQKEEKYQRKKKRR